MTHNDNGSDVHRQNDGGLRDQLVTEVRRSTERLVRLCCRLVEIDSQNPPGNTEDIVTFIEEWIGDRDDLEVWRVVGREPAVNLVVRLRMKTPGRRLIFNGHLDTFPVGDRRAWSVPPMDALVQAGRIYGRGVSDMKAGVAAALLTADLLWARRSHLAGELVLTLAGDEESGGTWGTKYLLENVPEAHGDAMMSGDAGSPGVVRFGEKGQIWVQLAAKGRSAHGGHVHLGVNAIDILIDALRRVQTLCRTECVMPDEIAAAVRAAGPTSEAVSGIGETEVLRSITANIGTIEGGNAINIVADRALAQVDLRFPPGLSVESLEHRLRDVLADLDGVELTLLDSCEPNWTEPGHEIMRLAVTHSAGVLSVPAVPNMRIGFSDARYYRLHGVPSVVYGPTPHNMGGPDEFVTIEDLEAVFYVHALSAFDYLRSTSPENS